MILTMTFRRGNEGKFELAYLKEEDGQERVITDLKPIQEELINLTLFVEMQQPPEEKAKEEADKKIEEMLKLITQTTTDEQKLQIISIYPPYLDGKTYSKDDLIPFVTYLGKLYRIIGASFESQPDWTPDVAKSLFVEVLPPGTIGEWKQPTGAHDAYKIGDRVIFDGWVWCSIINANTWSPSAYPQGWEKEREV